MVQTTLLLLLFKSINIESQSVFVIFHYLAQLILNTSIELILNQVKFVFWRPMLIDKKIRRRRCSCPGISLKVLLANVTQFNLLLKDELC